MPEMRVYAEQFSDGRVFRLDMFSSICMRLVVVDPGVVVVVSDLGVLFKFLLGFEGGEVEGRFGGIWAEGRISDGLGLRRHI